MSDGPVDQNLDALAVQLGDQRVELLRAAESRVHVREGGRLVPGVAGRRQEALEGDDAHAEVTHVDELAEGAVEVADAAHVGVGERRQGDAVDEGAAPPGEADVAGGEAADAEHDRDGEQGDGDGNERHDAPAADRRPVPEREAVVAAHDQLPLRADGAGVDVGAGRPRRGGAGRVADDEQPGRADAAADVVVAAAERHRAGGRRGAVLREARRVEVDVARGRRPAARVRAGGGGRAVDPRRTPGRIHVSRVALRSHRWADVRRRRWRTAGRRTRTHRHRSPSARHIVVTHHRLRSQPATTQRYKMTISHRHGAHECHHVL